ncbi:hypothetical protein RB653_001340 [Dictyostelium firmibasis]|uniref:EGF-like domain-containing protein n=1 Tax=Dictyostelium firmibasis TaxID=79012 RepID=A0AAN7TWU1_9MYCE
MSFIQKQLLFIVIFSFISLVFSLLPTDQKRSIDILLIRYNLQPISNDNYCGLPDFFQCDISNSTINKINLIGDSSNKVIFPNQTIDKFIDLKEISIKNSIISNLFFEEYFYNLKKIDLDNCSILKFPLFFQDVTTLYMNDIEFLGDIYLSSFRKLHFFKLTYSSGEKMSNYQFLTSDENNGTFIFEEFVLTVNNIVYYPVYTYSKLTLILGKYFDQESFNQIRNTTIFELKIVDVGYFNKQITIPFFTEPISRIKSVYLQALQFNTLDNEFMNFNGTVVSGLVINNCSGILNSMNDLKIFIGPIKYLTINYSNLKKIPFFYKDLYSINLSNNQISGVLPDLKEPETIDQVVDLDMSNNFINGTIPPNYCFHDFILTNNNMVGDIPMCIVCNLNDSFTRKRIDGNNFKNYISGSTNGFPPCSGVSFTSNPIYSSGSGILLIYGKNFGWQPKNSSQQTIDSTPDLKITVNVPNKVLNAFGYSNAIWEQLVITNFTSNLHFKIPNINTTLKIDILPPTVNFVLVNPYANLGYQFYILGYGTSTFGYYSNVTFDNYECIIISLATGSIKCVVYQPQMPEKTYKITIFNNQTKLTGTSLYKLERLYPFIISVNPSTEKGGLISLYGSFGPNVTFVSVIIGDQTCQNVTFDSSLIQCTIGPGTGVHSVYIKVNDVNWIGNNLFTFLVKDPGCPGDNKQCNGNGDCISGICFCYKGFGGIKCSNVLETQVDVKKNDTLTEMIKNGYSFGFSIKDIREIDFTGKVVRQHNFTKWELSSDSTIQKWTYINKYKNSIISYTIENIIGKTKNYSFAGETITLQPGSLKLSANISNWEYLGSLNTLQLQIESSVKAQEKNECEQKSDIQSTNNGASLNYITIQKDKNVFSGRFIDKVVSDGRPTFSRVSISELTQDSITVSLSLPYCKECLIDPDFSVMINPDSTSYNSCNGDQKSRLKWIIPVSVVVGLLGLFGIFALVFFLARDRIYISKKGGIILLKRTKKIVKINE